MSVYNDHLLTKVTEEECLLFHSSGKKGKLQVGLTKKLNSARDLSIAYSPGVSYPCIAINKDKDSAYDYTSKGNFVAVISNGTAVLGLGNLGAMASKPVMEGKSVLFKRFADIDSIDVEVDTTDAKDLIRTVRNIGETWGGINLEDIGSPDCFVIERELSSMLNVPVFHDDQHGTAIISLAGLINAAIITNRKLEDMKIVINGAGAAGLSCAALMKKYGIKHENIIICDTAGVVYEGREQAMNEWKAVHAVKTDKRTLTEALQGADAFFGLSVKGALSKDQLSGMAKDPIIFAMANPDPEITPEEAIEARPDCIIATGRSDYPNQINNVIGFPYIFRGALDVRASKITDEMKIAASVAISKIARLPVPEEIKEAYPGRDLVFGRNYIVPTPFDYRLIGVVSRAVAECAIKCGVARKTIEDFDAYENELIGRIHQSTKISNLLIGQSRIKKTVAFTSGANFRSIASACSWVDNEFGEAILMGCKKKINEVIDHYKISLPGKVKIIDPDHLDSKHHKYLDQVKKIKSGSFFSKPLIDSDSELSFALACAIKSEEKIDCIVHESEDGFDVELFHKLSSKFKIDSSLSKMSLALTGSEISFMISGEMQCDKTYCPKLTAKKILQISEMIKTAGHVPSIGFVAVSDKIKDRSKQIIDCLDGKIKSELIRDISLVFDQDFDKKKFSVLESRPNIIILESEDVLEIVSGVLNGVAGVEIVGPMWISNGFVHVDSRSITPGDVLNMGIFSALSV